jgi:hypothetical protein
VLHLQAVLAAHIKLVGPAPFTPLPVHCRTLTKLSVWAPDDGVMGPSIPVQWFGPDGMTELQVFVRRTHAARVLVRAGRAQLGSGEPCMLLAYRHARH